MLRKRPGTVSMGARLCLDRVSKYQPGRGVYFGGGGGKSQRKPDALLWKFSEEKPYEAARWIRLMTSAKEQSGLMVIKEGASNSHVSNSHYN